MSKSSSNIMMKFLATNPPSIAILGGILLMVIGGLTDDSQMSSNGMLVLLLGVFLQAMWLYSINAKRRR